MSKKNEDSIERFFRKAVTQHDTAFKESDWLKMEKMLDQKAAERAAIRSANLKRAAYSLIGLLMITASIVYVLISDGNTSLSTKEVLPEQVRAAAGEEAPRMDQAKEDPAAGLHSLSEQEQRDPPIPAGEEAAKSTDPVKKAPSLPNTAVTKRDAAVQQELSVVDAQDNMKAEKERGGAGQSDPGREADKVGIKTDALRVAGRSDQPVNISGDQLKSHGDQHAITPSISENRVSNEDAPSSEKVISFRDVNGESEQTHNGQNPVEDKSPVKSSPNIAHTLPIRDDGASTINSAGGQPSLKNVDKSSDHTIDKPAAQPVDIAVPDKQQGNEAQKSRTGQEEAGALLTEQPPAAALTKKQAGKDSTILEAPVDDTQPPAKDMQPVPTRWNVAVALAPDFSSTALERYTAPGEAYGISIGYQFLSRFAVSTGMIRSTKKYVGYGHEYQPPKGYWTNRTKGVIPNDITGKCAILEIPLMVQYTLRQAEKSRIFVAAGVSSYIMMSESYKYSFDTPVEGAAKGWSTSKSSTYPFAIGHLSAAYERQLSHRWAIGLEPFFKIPFAGVGWSNVNLYSTGVFINLRYRFFRKQQFAVSETRKTTQQ